MIGNFPTLLIIKAIRIWPTENMISTMMPCSSVSSSSFVAQTYRQSFNEIKRKKNIWVIFNSYFSINHGQFRLWRTNIRWLHIYCITHHHLIIVRISSHLIHDLTKKHEESMTGSIAYELEKRNQWCRVQIRWLEKRRCLNPNGF